MAALLVAAAFLLARTSAGDATTTPEIDTAAPIQPAQCVPCHYDLGDVQEPGLLFSHGNHLLVSCDGCHSRMPHRGSGTEKVPMETCFACHGVEHGPQGELATSVCRDCHTPSFILRPRDHSATWSKRPHVLAIGARGVNGCMMCHNAPADCDACHVKLNLGLGKMPDAYHTVIEDRPKGPSVKIYPNGPVTMSQCVYCHNDLDEITPGRLIFAHGQHLQRSYRCEACHPAFPHGDAEVAKPDMQSCYRCHGLKHAAQGLVATEECSACHPANFELMPGDHTKTFIRGDHKNRANADPTYCAMCHKSDFCIGCHQGKRVSRVLKVTAAPKKVVPADHKQASWRQKHGGPFLRGEGSCGSCHDSRSCSACHKTPMPHPAGWVENHKPAPGVDLSDCDVCHSDRSSCQKCHHRNVENGTLVASACVKCHPEMNTKKPTALKNKGFAEHAVHFNVAKKVPNGEPYTCDDCHISYGRATGVTQHEGQALPDAGHDVRLCYGCHGAVDFTNRLIAPYPGAALCVRCHTELRI